jgi:hypothetical protein
MRALGASRTSLVPGGVLAGPWVRDDLWRRARAVPSIDLRFADNKSLTDAVTGASLVTFTRASSGTFVDSAGVIQTAATDAPRFDHNPTTGESLGLLVEEQRTNLLLRSEEFDLSPWSAVNGLARTANQIAAPNGTLTADLLASGGTQIGYTIQSGSVASQFVSGVTYTFSVYLKKANTSTVYTLLYGVTFNSGGSNSVATWNLDTGVPSFSNGATGSMTAVGNGWYRCIITHTATASETRDQQWLRMASNSGDVYAWGAQLEAGAFPTSYIKNVDTAAGVTRNADVAIISGSAFSSWYRQDEGTVFVDFNGTNIASGQFPRILEFNDGTSNNSIRVQQYNAGANAVRASVVTAAVTQFAADNGSFAVGVRGKTAFGSALNDAALVTNGASPTTDATYLVPSELTQLGIGGPPTAPTSVLNSTIRRLTYWNQRLANSTLQQITQ